jgi:hypothetical protein
MFIQVPSEANAQSQTWSDYKHHNTLKCLVGITPMGVVSFVSGEVNIVVINVVAHFIFCCAECVDVYTGRISDKELTQKSGVLSKLWPNATIMADRGFDIQTMAVQHNIKLLIPPSTGKFNTTLRIPVLIISTHSSW